MASPGSIPGIPWYVTCDIHTILKFIKVSASDITDSDTIKFIKVDSDGHLEIVNKPYDAEISCNETGVGVGIYPYYVDMDNYRQSGFQIKVTKGSNTVDLKIYGTMMDLDNEALCTYQEITADIPVPWIENPMEGSYNISDWRGYLSSFKYIKFEFTIVGVGVDTDYSIYARKLY